MKQILITNDDGINAPGIIRLAEAALSFGDVTVIAPESERSAQSHSVTIRGTIDFIPCSFPVPGVAAWSCTGTPSDCVRAGLAWFFPEAPDLVLSGINKGFNIASDIQYSATVGAALEAAHEGIPSIALSGPYSGDFSVTDTYLHQILSMLQNQFPGRDTIFNVNFPAGYCRGILTDRFVSSGSMHLARYHLAENLAGGGLRLAADAIPDESCEEGSDFRAVLDHYISVGTVSNVG